MKKFMNKKEVIAQFRSHVACPPGDATWRRCAWLDYTDYLCKERLISQKQYNEWTNPFK